MRCSASPDLRDRESIYHYHYSSDSESTKLIVFFFFLRKKRSNENSFFSFLFQYGIKIAKLKVSDTSTIVPTAFQVAFIRV